VLEQQVKRRTTSERKMCGHAVARVQFIT